MVFLLQTRVRQRVYYAAGLYIGELVTRSVHITRRLVLNYKGGGGGGGGLTDYRVHYPGTCTQLWFY